MESGNESKGYVYCAHCDNVVSRSTFRRHERKRCSATSGSEIGQSQVTLYSSDSETSSSPVDEGEPVISSCTVRQVKDNNIQFLMLSECVPEEPACVVQEETSGDAILDTEQVMNLLSRAHG